MAPPCVHTFTAEPNENRKQIQNKQLHLNYRERQLHSNYRDRELHSNYRERQLHSNYRDRKLHSNYRDRQSHSSYRDRQLPPNYENKQLSSSHEREQLETATKRVKTEAQKNNTHPRDNSEHTKICQKGDVNREQHRSSDKSHGTTGRQRRKPRTNAKDNRPGHNSYSRTA